MAIRMYDLAAAEADRRFSPYCWRTRLALAHKELEVETIPWRFTEKSVLAFANWERVPVIIDQDKPVVDSWGIAAYLEDAYAIRPSLFGGAAGHGLARFYNLWADTVLNPALARFVMHDVYERLAPKDQPYFKKQSRGTSRCNARRILQRSRKAAACVQAIGRTTQADVVIATIFRRRRTTLSGLYRVRKFYVGALYQSLPPARRRRSDRYME